MMRERESLSRPLRLGLIVSIVSSLSMSFFLSLDLQIAQWLALAPENIPFLQVLLLIHAAFLLGGLFLPSFLPPAGVIRALSTYFVVIPMYGIGIFDVLLAGNLIFDFRADRLWVLYFLLPGFFALWLFIERTAESKTQAVGTDEWEKEALAKPDFLPAGAQTTKFILGSWVHSIVGQIIHVVFLIALMGIGYFSFLITKRALFQDRIIDLERVLSSLLALFKDLSLYGVVVGIALFLVFGGMAVFQALAIHSVAKDKSRYKRPLLAEEMDFLEECLDTLLAYVKTQKYARIYSFIYFPLGMVCLLVGMAGGVAFSILISFCVGYFAQFSASSTEVWVLQVGPFGAGTIIGIFIGIGGTWVLGQYILGLSPRFAEYAFVRGGWNTASSTPRVSDQYWSSLVRALRTDRIGLKKPFDCQQFLLGAYREFEPLIYRSFLIAMALLAVISVADGFNYRIFTSNGVVYSEYLEVEQHYLSYEDVAFVETGCTVSRRKNTTKPNMSYVLVDADGNRFDLKQHIRSDRLDRVEFINSRLVELGVEFVARENADRPSLDPECIPLLQERYSNNAQRVISLLRLN